MAELEEQVKAINEGREVVANILPGASLAKHYQIAFNLIPQIDVFKENLYTKEEMKMIDETKKIMSDDSLRITATTVRVPVYRSHAESVNVEFEDEISVEKAREVLAAFPGVTLTDNPDEQVYPMPLETSGRNPRSNNKFLVHRQKVHERIDFQTYLFQKFLLSVVMW